MEDFIRWCNCNQGFTSAVLSVIGLFVSLISIVVAIRTACLPYKKKIKVSASMTVRFTGVPGVNVRSSIEGITVNAVNVGNRTVYIDYLGICVRDPNMFTNEQCIPKNTDDITGKGAIAPGEVKSEMYRKYDLLVSLNEFSPKAKVFFYAFDTEGKKYYSKAGHPNDVLESLKD